MELPRRQRFRDSIPAHPFFPVAVRESGRAVVRGGHIGEEVVISRRDPLVAGSSAGAGLSRRQWRLVFHRRFE